MKKWRNWLITFELASPILSKISLKFLVEFESELEYIGWVNLVKFDESRIAILSAEELPIERTFSQSNENSILIKQTVILINSIQSNNLSLYFSL